MNEYLVGNVVRVSATFRSPSGTLMNPQAVLCSVKKGNAAKVTFVYGQGQIQQTVTGTYFLDVVADPVGLYTYNWYSTGTGQAAGQDNFVVTDSLGS